MFQMRSLQDDSLRQCMALTAIDRCVWRFQQPFVRPQSFRAIILRHV
jgi:hypothetical protein